MYRHYGVEVSERCWSFGVFRPLESSCSTLLCRVLLIMSLSWLVRFDSNTPSSHSLVPSIPSSSLQIVIPFFSLLIKDIYFLNEGCATRLPNGHINFEVGAAPLVAFSMRHRSFLAHSPDASILLLLLLLFLFHPLLQKLWELAKQVSEFLVWRQVMCPFDRDRRVLQHLVTTPILSEDGACSLDLPDLEVFVRLFWFFWTCLLVCGCRASLGLIRERRAWEQPGEGQP